MRTFLLLAFAFCPLCLWAQRTDTAFVAQAEQRQREIFVNAFKSELPIYTGGSYAEYVSLNEEHPYFLTNDWVTGSITYLGDTYPQVSMMYDISTESVVIEHLTSARKIKLANERIQNFYFDDHLFVHVSREQFADVPETAFYEQLVDGKVKLFARRKKNLQKRVVSGKLIASFDEINRYYILKDDRFIQVKTKNGILRTLSDKPQLKQEIKRRKIKFSSNRENAFRDIVLIYNWPNPSSE